MGVYGVYICSKGYIHGQRPRRTGPLGLLLSCVYIRATVCIVLCSESGVYIHTTHRGVPPRTRVARVVPR